MASRMLRLAVVLAAVAMINACVKVDHSNNGDNVDVKTPFGSVNVRTTDVKPEDTGLHVYPGSHLVPKHGDNDDQANVNISSPWGQLKVVALNYHTDDTPEKVLAWYRTDVQHQYGKLLECKGGISVSFKGDDNSQDHELSCDDAHKSGPHGNWDHYSEGKDTVELKAGDEDKQHIVAVKPEDGGTNIALVFVQKHGERNSI